MHLSYDYRWVILHKASQFDLNLISFWIQNSLKLTFSKSCHIQIATGLVTMQWQRWSNIIMFLSCLELQTKRAISFAQKAFVCLGAC